MLFKLILLNCFLIYVICDDLISIPELPKITIGDSENKKDDSSSSKNFKLSGQKHLISANGAEGIEKKVGNAEKVSNYEKDKGFFFMKAYGWDREKKNEHLNAEGKHLKASKSGKIFKAGGEFNKKLNEKHNNDENRNYYNKKDYGLSYGNGNQFSKRTGYSNDEYSKPYLPIHNEEFKYLQPQVEYTEHETPSSYELIEPKTNYYPNKEYTRLHYPKISGSYIPDYKNSKKYPIKNFLWNQGYHASKYYKPQTDHIEDNMVEYYGNEKKYNPNELNNYSNDHHYYGNDGDEDEGRHYYDKKITDYDIDKLRQSYSKYNDDYAGSQLLPQKVHIESPPPPTLEPIKTKKQYRLWEGSHYY